MESIVIVLSASSSQPGRTEVYVSSLVIQSGLWIFLETFKELGTPLFFVSCEGSHLAMANDDF